MTATVSPSPSPSRITSEAKVTDSAAPRMQTVRLGVHFEDRSALEDINLDFQIGETTSLVGPNGAGKSTLLKCLDGILAPTHGEVFLDGQPIHRPSPRVAYVPQRSDVDWKFPISVLDVALMGRALRASRLLPVPDRDREDALAALAQVRMRRFAPVQIGALSGGQQQRVFLARALLQEADVFLLDEPFSGVDAPTQALLLHVLDDLRLAGKTIVFATHDLIMAERSADVCVLLNRRVVAVGPPSQVLSVRNLQSTFGGTAAVDGEPRPTP
ncbi:MAG: transporter related [Thermomicrobiales bacterium]|jgi:ABC-type Mn2+/Zn2+ transport system ATPase subunit|nr:transporter related [Thermomicrobiales bacterium]MDF3014924.1 transporter related [Thermomicrobiales bacterium]